MRAGRPAMISGEATDVAVASAATTGILEIGTPLHLERGGILPRWRVAYRLHGTADRPVVLMLGGISADRYVCAASSEHPGWWDFAAGVGRPFDTRRYSVLSIDWLAGAGGSTGPDDDSRARDFPSIDTHDQATAVAAVVGHLGIDRLHAAIGASYGGMVVLALAERFAELLERAVVISAPHESHPMATALRVIQRETVKLGLATGRPREGLRIARALAMTTYRTASEFASRFSGAPEFTGEEWRFPVQSYLDHHGNRFADRFSPQRFLILSESNDLHCVIPESVSTPVTVIGVDSDTLVPVQQTEELSRRLRRCEGYHVVSSLYGHDAFLKDPTLIALAAAALEREVRE